MRKLDFYEFVAIIIPGTFLLAGAALCSSSINKAVFEQGLSVGESAISLILAYGLGQLAAALGNMIEKVWWWLWRGMPSDWPRSGRHHLLAAAQLARVDAALAEKLGLEFTHGLQRLAANEWFGVVRQMYAKVATCDAATRVDIFNGNYGLNRGLAAALLAVLVMVLITHGRDLWQAELLLVLGVAVAVYRMHRFGVHYARELFVQFLVIEVKGGSAPANLKG